MKFKLIKASSVHDKIQQIIDNNLHYDYMGDHGMVNPSQLLQRYEDMYDDIRPKNIDFGKDKENDYYIQYVSQGCKNYTAMFYLVYAAISKDFELKKMYQDGKLKIQVSDRNNWGDWRTFSKKKNSDADDSIKKKEFDQDYLNFVDSVEQNLKLEFPEEDVEIRRYEEEPGYELLLDLQLLPESRKNYYKQKAKKFANKFKITFEDLGGIIGSGIFSFLIKRK